jgi:hypothetical protein
LYSDNARFFHERGLVKDKSELTLDNMDVDLYPYLRGLLDGDGSIIISSREVRFLGQEKLLKSIQVKLDLVGFKVKDPRKDKESLWSIEIGGWARIKDILRRLYGDSTIHLDRKKILAQKVLDHKPFKVRKTSM